MSEPVCFFPETSYALAEKIAAGKSLDSAKAAALRKWRSDGWTAGEGDEDHIRRCFDETVLDNEQFQQVALAVYGPVFQQVR